MHICYSPGAYLVAFAVPEPNTTVASPLTAASFIVAIDDAENTDCRTRFVYELIYHTAREVTVMFVIHFTVSKGIS